MTPEAQIQLAKEVLEEHKGVDIVSIDVSELTDVTDFIIISTATSQRHASTLADKVSRAFRNKGIHTLGTEGANQKDGWVLIDLGDIVVHIMLAEAREFYSLEKLWGMKQQIREKAVGEN